MMDDLKPHENKCRIKAFCNDCHGSRSCVYRQDYGGKCKYLGDFFTCNSTPAIVNAVITEFKRYGVDFPSEKS